MSDINLIGVKNVPFIQKGDNIANIIVKSLKNDGIFLKEGDVIVIAQSIVSKSQGYVKDLKKIIPSKQAHQIYEKIKAKSKGFEVSTKSPELIQAIIDESKDIIKTEHVIIVETLHGFICANAGIDKSNIEGQDKVTLLPEDPDKDAEEIRMNIKELTNQNVAVIISDSFGRPFRRGAVGIAVGISGIDAVLDMRGSKDLFGRTLETTIVGQIDNLASAAQLIMGEADEGLPIVIIRGYKFEFSEQSNIKHILRDKSTDVFRTVDEEQIIASHLKSRRSYKFDFKSEKVDRTIIEECIDIARYAPSAHNYQHWRYIILEKNPIRKLLIELVPRQVLVLISLS